MAKDTEVVNPTPTIEDLPDTQIAGTPAGQPLDQAGDSAVTLESVLASPELQEYIDKRVKSQQDVRLGKYGTRLDILEEGSIEKYEALKEQGMSQAQAKHKMQEDKERVDMRAQLDSLLGGNKPAPSAGAGEQDWAGKQASILENAGIAKDDPRIVELLRTSKSKQDFVVALEEQTFAWKQADALKPQPSGSTIAQTIPSVPSGDGSYTVDKYKTDMLAAQGKPAEVRRIKAAARKDGVDVDNIGFGN